MNKNDVLVILGSSRQNSTTLEAVQSELPFKDYELVELCKQSIHPYDYDSAPKDDFLNIVDKMINAKTIVFATPVYWYSMSGYLKTFFDRLTELITTCKHLGRQLKGKEVYLLSTGSDVSLPDGFEIPFKRTCEYFEMNYIKSYYFSNLQSKSTNKSNSAQQKPLDSYFAVILSSTRTNEDSGYEDMANKMLELSQMQKGFIGSESVRDSSGHGITISYWVSLEDIKNWKTNSEHLVAQKMGKTQWYKSYTTRICKVEREYSFKKAYSTSDV